MSNMQLDYTDITDIFKEKLKLANKCQAIFEKNWIVKKGNFNKHHSR